MSIDCTTLVNASIIFPWRNTDRAFTILSVIIWLTGIMSRVPAKITIFHKISLCSSNRAKDSCICQVVARIAELSSSIQGQHASSNIQIDKTLKLVQGVLKTL
jgi:hypothetical protein